MSNGSEACCALGICCPDAAGQQTGLVKILVDDGCEQKVAEDVAASILSRFALAPKSFTAMVAEMVALQKIHGHD